MDQHSRSSHAGLHLRFAVSFGAAVGLAFLSWHLFPDALTPPDRAETVQAEAARLVIDDANVSDIQLQMVSGPLSSEHKAWAWDYALDLANQDHPVPPDSRLSLLIEGKFSSQTEAILVIHEDPTTGRKYFQDCVALAANSEKGITSVIDSQPSGSIDIHGWKLSLRGRGDPSTSIRRVEGAYHWQLRELADLILVYCRDGRDPYLTGRADYGTVEFPRVAVLMSEQRTFPNFHARQSLIKYPLDVRAINGRILESVFSGTYRLPSVSFSGDPESDTKEDIDLTTFVKVDDALREVDVARWRYPIVPSVDDDVLGVDLEIASRWTQFQSVSAESHRQRNTVLAGVLLGLIVPTLLYAAKTIRKLKYSRE